MQLFILETVTHSESCERFQWVMIFQEGWFIPVGSRDCGADLEWTSIAALLCSAKTDRMHFNGLV